MTERMFLWVGLFVLVGAVSVQAVTTDLVIDANAEGDNGASNPSNHSFRVALEGDTLRIYVGDELSRSIEFASVGRLTINGSAHDDTLTVDFSGGNPIPAGGLVYNGLGNVTATGDTLVMGGGHIEEARYRFASRTDGSIEIDSRRLIYTGLEPIIDTVPATTLTVTGTNASNAITYRQGVSSPTNGLVAVDSFETIEFANKTNLVINALDGNDDVVIGSPPPPAGLTSITVNGGYGNDVVSVSGGSPVSVTMNGDDGDDLFRVSPTAGATLAADGGGHVLGDKLFVDATASKGKDRHGVVEIDGFFDVPYLGMEAVVVVDDRRQKTLLKERPAF